MALIAHLCTTCKHPDFWRLGRKVDSMRCENGPCKCLKCTPGPPELRPTYDQAGRTVDRVIKPGDKLHSGVPTCGCDLCKTLYKQLTA